MSVLESNIEDTVVKVAVDLGYIVLKLTPEGQRGWPDRVFINQEGVHVYIEFKRPGEKPRKLQEYRYKMLADRGCNVYTGIDDPHTAVTILRRHLL